MIASTALRFDHLSRLSDGRGLFEHAEGTERRVEHGYCTDDNARLLVVTSREPDVGIAGALSRTALAFVVSAQSPAGRVRNRMAPDGAFTDRASTDDCWGRAIWGLGVAARHHDDPTVRAAAADAVLCSMRRRSTAMRAMAFAALGACEVPATDPGRDVARALLADVIDAIRLPPATSPWPWPEPRLTYANAAVAEALLVAGTALDRPAVVERALALLRWLVARQTWRGHLSVVGQDGRGPLDPDGPTFDQQAIEVSTLADACWRAFVLTADPRWAEVVHRAAAWFDGDNDGATLMVDHASGGGYDGLEPTGANRNQGAESTLAFVSTMQRARDLASA